MGIYQQVLTFLSLEYEHEMIKKAETTMLENLLIKAIEEEGVKDGTAYCIETQTSVRCDPDDGLCRLIKGLRIEEIVRCKDCRWYKQKQKNLPYNQSRSYCNRSCVAATKENDFCSYGERSEE